MHLSPVLLISLLDYECVCSIYVTRICALGWHMVHPFLRGCYYSVLLIKYIEY